MLFENLNKNKKLFNVEIENPIFKKLGMFEENEILQVLGCYLNKKSHFGTEPIYIVKDFNNDIYFVNSPKHHIDTVNEIIGNAELVDGINQGKCFIKVIKYFSKKYNKQCFDIEFITSSVEEMKKQSHKQDDVKEDIF